MSQWGRLEQVVTDLRDGRSGRLSIGYFASAGSAWMPALVRRLTAEYPDLVLELRLNEVEQGGPRPDLDLVIDPPDTPLPAGLRRVDLTEDPFVAVLPRDHAARGRTRDLADGPAGRDVGEQRLPPAPSGHRVLVAACAAVGLRPRFTVQAQDHHTAIGFVAAGIGVSVMPGLAARGLPPSVVRVDLAPPAPVRHLAVVVRRLGGVDGTDRAGGAAARGAHRPPEPHAPAQRPLTRIGRRAGSEAVGPVEGPGRAERHRAVAVRAGDVAVVDEGVPPLVEAHVPLEQRRADPVAAAEDAVDPQLR